MTLKSLLSPLLACCLWNASQGQDTNAVEAPKTPPLETTPLTLPGAETFVFKKIGEAELRLHVVKPKGWKATDKHSCLVAFFGGGWSSGTPEKSLIWAQWAASHGMVGVASDYRTRLRFQTTPEDCVADGRAAVRWLQDHAAELGIDPAKMVSLGVSAGGHVAAWTALPGPVSPATAADPAPSTPPAALVLLWPVTDTSATGYGGPKRFGNDEARANALSVPARMPVKMPPTLVFHGTADKTVKYDNSKEFVAKMKANGNRCELITLEGAPHSANSSKYEKMAEVKATIDQEMQKFLTSLNLISVK